MSDGITYRWLTEADLKEIVRRETEALRALLVESRDALSQGCWNGKCCTVRDHIDAALAAMTEKP